jgi:serine/threonine-protein kinase
MTTKASAGRSRWTDTSRLAARRVAIAAALVGVARVALAAQPPAAPAPPPAAAAPPAEVPRASTAADKAAAETLYEEAKRLLAAGQIPDACAKFEQSLKLDVGLGTMLHLADCYERNGQTASAWGQFREAAAAAKAAGRADRERIARERAAALEPKLARLTIQVAADAESVGVQVKRDGATVDKPLWGLAVPVDPGVHTVEVTAPGRRKWWTTIEVHAASTVSVQAQLPELDSASVQATLPPIAPATPPPAISEPPPAPAPAAPPDEGRPGAQHWVALGFGVAGVVAVGVGIGFGVKAMNDDSEANDHCREGNLCDPEGVALGEDASSAATLSTIAFVAGGAALGAGLVLWLTAPSSPAASEVALRIGPAPEGAGATAAIAW